MKKEVEPFSFCCSNSSDACCTVAGFSFVDDLFTTAGVTTKASAQDIAQTDTSQKIGTYPYFANEPADCDASAKTWFRTESIRDCKCSSVIQFVLCGKERSHQ